jgi:hypothetical protein
MLLTYYGVNTLHIYIYYPCWFQILVHIRIQIYDTIINFEDLA